MMVALIAAAVVWLIRMPAAPDRLPPMPPDNGQQQDALRLGLIPERDIFAQRLRYQALAEHLSDRLERPIVLVTLNTYEGVLKDFEEKQIDGAFLGSMVAVLAHDRLGAQILVKPQNAEGVSVYRGVIVVRRDSPITSIEDLAGRSVAMVRTTTAGNLFPVSLMLRHGLLDARQPPQFRWVGTHDQVIAELMAGRVDAGAVKDLRLDAFERANAPPKLVRLAVSEPVPNNALVVRADVDPALRERLEQALLTMHENGVGREALAAFGAGRFLTCRIEQYKAIYDMADQLGPAWQQLGVSGPAPRRPSAPAGP